MQQQATAQTKRWLAEDGDLALWTLTPVEATSALWRLVREGQLDVAGAHEAEVRADELMRRAVVVTEIERIQALARRLLRVHSLGPADAMQLGAALTWADGDSAGRVVHTLDRRLALAAEREGFRVVPAPGP